MSKKNNSNKKDEKIEKPKYGILQNCVYMIKLAWKHNKSILWVCLILTGLYVASNLLGLYFTPTILGAIETAEGPETIIITVVLFSLAIMFVNAATSYINANRDYPRYELRSLIMSFVVEKITTTSYPNTENQEVRNKYEYARRAVSGGNPSAMSIWVRMTDLLKNFLSIAVYFLVIAVLEPWIVSVVLITTLIAFFFNKNLDGWRDRRRLEMSEYNRRMSYINEKSRDHTFAKDIRLFGMHKWLDDIYNSTLRLYQSFTAREQKVYIWTNIIDLVFAFARNGIAYFYLVNLVLSNDISASEFLLVFSAVGGMTAEMTHLFMRVRSINYASMPLSGMREFLEYEEPFLFEKGEALEPDLSKSYEIVLHNVSFRYPQAENDALSNINLTIKHGEKLAIVGLNGAGKTTLIKVMCGFYDPTEGEVLLNGVNIKRYNRRDYYKHFAAVFQDFSILPTTIAQNISQATNEIDMQKVMQSAEKAGVSGKINNFKDKYETHVTKRVFEDGVELSGGETQRLMMARALFKDAPVIVLDEPTAALDPIAESDVYNRYNELTSGKTSVYISHRLASTRFCDRVILLDGKEIAEVGTHDELIKQGKRYAELYEIQSHYYKEGAIRNG